MKLVAMGLLAALSIWVLCAIGSIAIGAFHNVLSILEGGL